TLGKDIGVSTEEAQAFIDAYFAGFTRVRTFIDRTLADARATGVVKTMYGRRRIVPDIMSRDFQRRSAAERVAGNLPIRGTAADIMKRAMIDTHAALADEPGARMILTVHDELVFEVPRDRADRVAGLVRDRMQSAARLQGPLTVDVDVGENWKEAKSWTAKVRYSLFHGSLNLSKSCRSASGGCASARARSGTMPRSTRRSRSARRATPRSPARPARTQPACAAAHAAWRSPWPRAAADSQYDA